ncbi:MAG: saccharopine dehydrogenase NADP-binding domain-containing protein, partial [Candidatus Thorarchaeota archaeon]|nr:saccharopine dehydrogenase NADP-binding domain-containing protein [Candidatus Thorarchaeota archaeon]
MQRPFGGALDLKALVLGSGLMGRGAAFDLARNDAVKEVIVADRDLKRAESLAKEMGPKVVAETVDAADRNQLKALFAKVDTVTSEVSYKLNLLHTEVAIATGTHMCDLGGNLKVVEKQLKLHDKAKAAGVTVIPDCGLAPGLANVLARAGIDYLTRPESVKIRVGGLQQEPRPPLNYSLIFAVEGLINEYIEPCMVLRDGKIAFEEPLIGFEQVEFPEPYGILEAFNTSGGSSTLPLTYEGKVANLDYKTLRYPGHGHKMWCLMKLGLMDSKEQDFGGVKVAPRAVLEKLLEQNLPPTGSDVTLLRVTVEGWKGTESRKIEYEIVDLFDDKTGLTSMMRTTSFTASTAATMMADGTISERGVLPPEKAIPPEPFIEEMK